MAGEQQPVPIGIMQVLAKLLPQLGAAVAPQAPGQMPSQPARVGGAPPQLAAPPPGAIPGQPQQQAAQGIPRTMPQPAQQGPAFIPYPQPGAMQTGMEFNTKAGARAATVSGVISNMTQAIGRAKQQQAESQRAKASNYAAQLAQAMADGDQETVKMMLSDPKIVKTIEKGLDYVFPKEPGAPPPPEARGLMQGIKKVLGKGGQDPYKNMPAAGQPGGVHMPKPSMAAQANQKSLSFGPEQAAMLKQNVVDKADPVIQPALNGMLETAQMFPAQAPEMVKAMMMANVGYISDKASYGQKIAMINMQEQFRTSLESMKEQNRAMLQMATENSKDERQLRMFKQQSELLDKRLDFETEKLSRTLDAKLSPKPLNAKQSLAVTQTRDISKRVITSLDEALSPDVLKVLDSTFSSITARGLTSMLGRFVPASAGEQKAAKIFTRLKEQANALRGPYGATGFRSREALSALWDMVAANKWWYQDPAVTKQVLQDARADHQLLIDDADEALAVGKTAPTNTASPTPGTTEDDPLGILNKK